jgi:bacteriorhodopsin
MIAVVLGATGLGLSSLVGFLIALVVICVILYAVSLVLGMLSFPPPIKQLIWLVVAVIVLIALLSYLGLV